MEASVVTTKGQVVIPSRLRRVLGIRKGTRIYFRVHSGTLVLRPATPMFYEEACGILKGGGLLRALEESRREELKHEERKVEGRKGSG